MRIAGIIRSGQIVKLNGAIIKFDYYKRSALEKLLNRIYKKRPASLDIIEALRAKEGLKGQTK